MSPLLDLCVPTPGRRMCDALREYGASTKRSRRLMRTIRVVIAKWFDGHYRAQGIARAL